MQNLFSFPLTLEDLGTGTKVYHLAAKPEQLPYITEVLKVNNIISFKSELEIKFNRKIHRIDIHGRVEADVEQTSVVSLEKFIKRYQPEFSLFFDTELTAAQLREMEFEIDDEVPDVIENGQIDLAAIAMEQLALALDDFPRQEGEVFEFKSEFDEETTAKQNPFAALAALKK